MAMGSGISVMGKNTDLDANQVGNEQALANQLLLRALQQPQQPDKSWTQGAARMAEMLVSAYKASQAQKKQDKYNLDRQNSMTALATALAGGDQKAIAAAIAQMKDPQSQMMGLQQMALMQQERQKLQNEIAKDDRHLTNQKAEATHKSGLDTEREIKVNKAKNADDAVKAAQARMATTSDVLARTQDAISRETDPQKKAALQKTINALQAQQKADQTILLSTRGHQYSEAQNTQNAAYQNMNQGVNPKDLPKGQQQALQSPFSPLAAENKYQAKVGEHAAERENKTLEDYNAQLKSINSMQAKSDQILQQIAAHPNLKGGKGAETMSELQTTLHQYVPGLVPGNEDQQLYNKLLKQMLVDASGIMRGEAGSGFRLTQNELLYIISKTVPELSTNSAQGVKDILEAAAVMNEPIRRRIEAANQIILNPDLNPAQKQEALAKLDRAANQELQNSTMGWVNAKLAPMGQKIEINPDFDPVKNPVNKYRHVQMDESGKPVSILDNYNQASMDKEENAPIKPVGNEPQQNNNQEVPPQSQVIPQQPPASKQTQSQYQYPSIISQANAKEEPTQNIPQMPSQPLSSVGNVEYTPQTPIPDLSKPTMADALKNPTPQQPQTISNDPKMLAAIMSGLQGDNSNVANPYNMAFPSNNTDFNNLLGFGGY